jgi:tRNA(fMet)-specific endonuclease VapC
MNGRFLLDTNIVIAIFANDPAVRQSLTGANEVFVPSIVLGELYYGAYKSTHADANMAKIDDFAGSCSVLTCDTDTSRHYGKIKNALRLKGRPIPENDIWIAAISKQYALTLVSRDDHFLEVGDLITVAW